MPMHRPMLGNAVVALPLLMAGLLSAGVAQVAPPVVVIPNQPSCQTCRIRLAAHMVLGDTAGVGEFPRQAYMVRTDERGRFFVSFIGGEMPMVFSPRGQYVRQLGREGDGPGEFRKPLVIGVHSDTAWVVDWGTARITALFLTGDSVSYAGSWPSMAFTRPPYTAERLASGPILANIVLPTAANIGFPLHLVSLDGRIVSFGVQVPEFRSSETPLSTRAIAPASDGGAWVAHRVKYEFERYDKLGRLVGTWRRDVPWFRPHQGEQRMNEERPPQPGVVAIGEDTEGRVWVVVRVADSRHRQAFRPRTPGQDANVVNLERPDLYSDMIIEVFDVRRGVLLATHRVDEAWGAILGRLGQGILVVRPITAPYGGSQIVVHRVELINASR